MFSFEKNCCEITDYLEKLMMNMLHRKKVWWFQRIKIGDFDVAGKEHEKPPKKYEDMELQALLDEDDSQTQK